ncbi:hypothetical protein AB0M28_28435 [Streptomyces sp. NPDC051940]|uniref:hypothetical protein n=1 Tax=Streptomyces sp. NPDC051940 TaxID=3155675 RepID=UPI003418D228
MSAIEDCLHEALALPGARSAALVEWATGFVLASVGASAHGGAEETAIETAELARIAIEQVALEPEGLPGEGGGSGIEDVIVTTPASYHVLRFVDMAFDSGVFVHLRLDRATGNLALARLRLRSVAERLVGV